MNENNENNNEFKGEITGFDEVKPDDFKEEQDNKDDGFYTKSRSDIIQDSFDFEPNNSQTYFNGDFHSDNNNYYGDNDSNSYNYNSYEPPVRKSKKKDKKKYGAGVVVISCILAAIVGAVSSLAVLHYNNDNGPAYTKENLPQVENKEDNAKENTSENVNITVEETVSSIAQAVAKKCKSSVVGIRTTTSVISFFGGMSESTGEGSGVVYTKDGFIVTNYHVIENAVMSSTSSKIEVFIEDSDSKGYEADVIGYNISCDLAVLKINAKNLPTLKMGNSDDLNLGQYAVTIGAPGGLEFMGSVTYGIISGLNRVVSSNSAVGLIQTDAAINPGNSGGALLDQNGSLIGINSSKIVSEEFEGMGFAIPINTVIKICNGIISNKDKAEPYVGITVSEKYTSDILEAYGYPAGAVVLSVAEGSTAENCGIKKGDIITEFNGKKITEYNVFSETLAKCKPGSRVPITVYRSGRYYQAEISIASNTSGNQ